MKTERTARLWVALAAALGLLVWTSPASAALLRPGGIGPRGSGLRLSASGTGDISGNFPDFGGRHTCAVIADGSVRCWGEGAAGQLGNGGSSASNVPVTVTRPGGGKLTGVTAVAAGASHTCAARADGTVFCWGDNAFGKLGGGAEILPASNVALQVKVAATVFTGAVTVAAGNAHTCALRFDGTVHCWGRNSHRQLGNEFLSASSSPLQVGVAGGAAFTGAVAIAAGSVHTCAVRVDGTAATVHCWGANNAGQLGIGSTGGLSATPVKVTVAGGSDFTGSTPPRSVPVTVIKSDGGDLLEVVAIAAGVNHTCALHANGAVSCWGGNGFGELGDASSVGVRSRAVTVVSLPDATALVAGPAANHTCALRANGSLRCWGRNLEGQLGDGTILNRNFPVPVNGVTDAVALAAGFLHSCAVRVSSLAACWGQNDQSQLGNGTRTAPNPPGPVTVIFLVLVPNQPAVPVPLTGAVGLAAGSKHTCVLVATGQVGCWGDNGAGQIGDGTNTDRLSLAAVPSFAFNVEEAVALGGHSRVATVTALALCEPGAEVQIRVELIQGAVSGHGITLGRCTGVLERYEVTVPARGRAGFAAGPATAVADAIVRVRGQVLDEPHWTRAVQLTP